MGLVLGSSMLGGLRWTSSEVLLKGVKDTSGTGVMTSFRTLMWITPAATVAILPFYLAMEHRTLVNSQHFEHPINTLTMMGLILLGGLFACPLLVVELAVVCRSSALTYNVAG